MLAEEQGFGSEFFWCKSVQSSVSARGSGTLEASWVTVDSPFLGTTGHAAPAPELGSWCVLT